MIFSVGVAFTNAHERNLMPNPQREEDLKNAIACAKLLRDNPELRGDVSSLVDNAYELLNDTLTSLEAILKLLNEGLSPEEIPLSLYLKVYRSTFTLRRIREEFQRHLNCTMLGYPTSLELLPREVLEKVDSLITLGGIFSNLQALSRNELYNYTIVGISITQSLIDYVYLLDHDYEGYMNKFILSAQKELEDPELKFVGFENFKRLFTEDPRFYNSLFRTLLFVATSVPLKVRLGVFLALFYSSDLVLGKKALRALLVVPWTMPFLLSTLTWRFLFLLNGQFGELFSLNISRNEWDAFLVYNLFETWLAYPFVMTVTQGALRGVSKDIIEASYIDGAGVFFRFRRVVLPQI